MLDSDALKLCLFSNAEPIRTAVRVCCLPPNQVDVFSLSSFLGPDAALSEEGEGALRDAEGADAVLVEWSLEGAPLINMICSEVRRRSARLETFIPVIALCSGSQEEMIAARAAGADEAMGFPIYLPLIQACVAAHRRKAEAVQRATSKRLKERHEDTQKEIARQVDVKAEALADDLTERIDENGVLPAGLSEATEQHVEEESAEFAKTLLEEVVGEMVEDIEGELVLLDPEHDICQVGDLRLDRTAYRFHVRNEEVDLTPKEFELLSFLMEHAEKVCSRDEILDEVWGIDFETGTNMVEVYMHFLRKKLEAYGLNGMIQTVRGRGYRLAALRPQP